MTEPTFLLRSLPAPSQSGSFHPLFLAYEQISALESERIYGNRDHSSKAIEYAERMNDADEAHLAIVAIADESGVEAGKLAETVVEAPAGGGTVGGETAHLNTEAPASEGTVGGETAGGGPAQRAVNSLRVPTIRAQEHYAPEQVAGRIWLGLPLQENFNRAHVGIAVRDWQSALVGALFDTAEQLCAANGRTEIVYWRSTGQWAESGDTVQECPAPEPGSNAVMFALRNPEIVALEAHGYRPMVHEWELALNLDLAGQEQAVHEEIPVPTPGYEIETWRSPHSPERVLEELANIYALASTDMPGADSDEPEHWDIERVRNKEALYERINQDWLLSVVRPVGGEIVGWSSIGIAAGNPALAHQAGTLVRSDHRGKRLATWMKQVNLASLREFFPAVRTICTENEGNNVPVLAMNKRMGFQPIALSVRWDKDLS